MATVGNLFVNIRGNTSGLEKALGRAKKRLNFFHQWSSAKSARADVEKYRDRQRAILNDPNAFGSIMQRYTPGFQKAKLGEAKAAKALDAAQMGMFMNAAFATIGVTAAAVGFLIREGTKVQKTTEQDFETYTAAGAAGRVRKLLDRIQYVQRADVQQEQRVIQDMERTQLQRERDVYGPTGADWRAIGIDMRQMGSDIAGALTGRNSSLTGGF